MKISKILYTVLIMAAFVNTGCDKEDDWLEGARAGGKDGVGFGETFINGLPVYALPDAGNIEEPIKVFLSGKTYGSEINVSITGDPSLVDAFNAANGTSIKKAPAGLYTLPGTIKIPANSKEGSATGSLNITGLFNLNEGFVFAIGLRIGSIQGGTTYALNGHDRLVLIVTIQNEYDADYAVKGYFIHPSAPRAIAATKHLYTVNASRCEGELGDLGGSNFYFAFDVDASNKLTNWGAVGATPPAPQSGFMTLDNPAGVGTYPGGEFTHANYNNTYDGNGVFLMHYGYATGAAGQAGYTRQVYEKWTKN